MRRAESLPPPSGSNLDQFEPSAVPTENGDSNMGLSSSCAISEDVFVGCQPQPGGSGPSACEIGNQAHNQRSDDPSYDVPSCAPSDTSDDLDAVRQRDPAVEYSSDSSETMQDSGQVPLPKSTEPQDNSCEKPQLLASDLPPVSEPPVGDSQSVQASISPPQQRTDKSEKKTALSIARGEKRKATDGPAPEDPQEVKKSKETPGLQLDVDADINFIMANARDMPELKRGEPTEDKVVESMMQFASHCMNTKVAYRMYTQFPDGSCMKTNGPTKKAAGSEEIILIPMRLLPEDAWILAAVDVRGRRYRLFDPTNMLLNDESEGCRRRKRYVKRMLHLNSPISAPPPLETYTILPGEVAEAHESGVFIIAYALCLSANIEVPPAINPDIWRSLISALVTQIPVGCLLGWKSSGVNDFCLTSPEIPRQDLGESVPGSLQVWESIARSESMQWSQSIREALESIDCQRKWFREFLDFVKKMSGEVSAMARHCSQNYADTESRMKLVSQRLAWITSSLSEMEDEWEDPDEEVIAFMQSTAKRYEQAATNLTGKLTAFQRFQSLASKMVDEVVALENSNTKTASKTHPWVRKLKGWKELHDAWIKNETDWYDWHDIKKPCPE